MSWKEKNRNGHSGAFSYLVFYITVALVSIKNEDKVMNLAEFSESSGMGRKLIGSGISPDAYRIPFDTLLRIQDVEDPMQYAFGRIILA